MKKHILLPLLALAGGAGGLILHRWELSAAWDAQSGLFRSGHPATLALIGLSVGMAILCLVLSRGGKSPEDWTDALRCPSSAYLAVMVTAAMLLLASVGFGVVEFRERLILWIMDARRNLLPLMQGLCTLISVPAAVSILFLGRGSYRGILREADRWVTTMPAYMGAFWLIVVYQQNAISPFPIEYAYELLSTVCLLLALYFTASSAYDHSRPAMGTFFGMMGVYLDLVAMGGTLTRLELLRRCALLLLVLGQLYPLLRARFGPVWTAEQLARMPAGTDQDDKKTDAQP